MPSTDTRPAASSRAHGAPVPRTVTRLAAAAVVLSLGLAACSSASTGAPGGSSKGEKPDEAAAGPQVREDLEKVFADAGIKGTFAALDSGTGKLTVVHPDEVEQQEFPASTFKIPNSLISLQAGAVADADEVVPYGGEPQRLPEWEHDMSIRDALPISAFPIYQELARRVGHEDMGTWVERFDYGTKDIGGEDDIDEFWLRGPLKISAEEQVRFLDKAVHGDLPVDDEHIETLREIMDQKVDDPEGRDLYWKSGWAEGPDPMVGWMVGWVEDGDRTTAFALRLEMETDEQAELRKTMARDLLDRMKILPESA
ncbi:beta-lactamase class D [Murinocardiopsis flavida]|uniref:Beta-lactamase n=1 Tax=Murinocardiopsis flavida TaxID=645275 RepID=A0A2P8CW18_9ACTN|nr:class D beta-lactamase [Murinocardiopsis flavida]PSK89147.1 beta-lactamase class D [Murinocardiopsis flavida]